VLNLVVFLLRWLCFRQIACEQTGLILVGYKLSSETDKLLLGIYPIGLIQWLTQSIKNDRFK